MSADTPAHGAWAGDSAALAAATLSGRGSDLELPPPQRFRANVTRCVVLREKLPEAEYDRPCAFVFTPAEILERLPETAIRTPFLNTGHYPLTGQVHFVGVTGNGKSQPYDGAPGDLLDALNTAGVATLPTLVYDPKPGHSTLSWYPRGVADDASVELTPVIEVAPTPERIAETISAVHRGELITPDQVPAHDRVWEDADKGWAKQDAEARVQRVVRIGLQARFPMCRIRAEQPDKDGRTDIEVVEEFGRSAGEVVHYAVLELKVLREKGSTGNGYSAKEITDHMDEGVNQASSYGDGRNFLSRMLCCFDMRSTNAGEATVFAPFTAKAETLKVHLRHWFLYRSSGHWRQCQVAQKLTAAQTPPSPH